jgi:energy-coupling factor transport system ATP-binding protein
MRLFEFCQLSYLYPDRKNPSLNKIDLRIQEGEFVLLTGPSGGGKTTLARCLARLIPHFYGGRLSGQLLFKGQPIMNVDRSELHQQIGMVFQDPEKQMIMGQVERDIALGLENLGVEPAVMIRRMAEVLTYLGLERLRDRITTQLSSGEKQRVAIGSILAMMPRVLIFDEPTSQLDPVAGQETFSLIQRLHQEHGFTIILIEQRLEHCFHLADRVILMDEGQIILDQKPEIFAARCPKEYRDLLPPVPRLFSKFSNNDIPLTIVAGRKRLRDQNFREMTNEFFQDEKSDDLVMDLKSVEFSYDKTILAQPILANINLKFFKSEFAVILGENGAGKSTLLKLMAGVNPPREGHVDGKNCRIAYLSQNPNDYLFNDTVESELRFTMNNLNIQDDSRVDEILRILDIENHRDAYPRDLSAGERQRVALGSILVSDPDMILLDEPTRGLDSKRRTALGRSLQKLILDKTMCVVMVTQDVEFAAEFATRIILMSKGQVIAQGEPQTILRNNLFYSTQMNKLFQGISSGIISFTQASQALTGEIDE